MLSFTSKVWCQNQSERTNKQKKNVEIAHLEKKVKNETHLKREKSFLLTGHISLERLLNFNSLFLFRKINWCHKKLIIIEFRWSYSWCLKWDFFLMNFFYVMNAYYSRRRLIGSLWARPKLIPINEWCK